MNNPFISIADYLKKGRRMVLARIIRQSGSTPRRLGTGFLVFEDGSIRGTIGGGAVEHRVIEAAKQVFTRKQSQILKFRLTGTEVAETDMICGGTVDVFLEPLSPHNRCTCIVFEKIQQILSGNCRARYFTLVADGIPETADDCRLVIDSEDTLTGRLDLDQKTERPIYDNLTGGIETDLIPLGSPERALFLEVFGPEDLLLLFGGGHVSGCVAPLAQRVGFKVWVIDDRDEFANKERFPDAERVVVAPFGEVFEQLTVNKRTYIAIITRGHIHDHDVLKAALATDAAYIGMIGSTRKRDMIYHALIEAGIARERLAEVHSPIGLDIGGDTPEEIAVSIVGQLIQVKHGRA